VPLVSTPVTPTIDGPGAAFAFAIAAGVRRGNTTLRAAVDRAIVAEGPAIRAVLAKYGVPIVKAAPELGQVPEGRRRSLASLGMTGSGCAAERTARRELSCE
jgi:thiamine pyrophosphate-dependent acetolactate synthase large subunit-like protein